MADIGDIISSAAAGLESGGADIGGAPEETGAVETPTEAVEQPAGTETPSGEDGEAVIETAPDGTATQADKPKKWIRRDQAQRDLQAAQKAADTKIAELNAKLQQLAWAEQAGVKDKLDAFEIAERDPERFVQALLKHEAYPGLMLAALKAHPTFATHFAQEQAAAQQRQQPPSDMPAPQLMADGTEGYSLDGLKQLLAWNRAEATKEALTEAEKRFNDRLKQYDEVINPIKQRDEARERNRASFERTGQQLKAARDEWPGFKEHEKEIGAWLDAFWKTPEGARKVGIEALNKAYVAVVIKGKMQPDRDKMRQELIAELRGQKTAAQQVSKPKAPAAAGGNGPRSIEDIIASKAAELEEAA